MLRKLLLLIICFAAIAAYSQTYSPITVVGYNHDVIAEGAVPGSEATTTKEMDAFTPSNFVICTEEFAATNSLPLGYGIPNSGYISNSNRAFQLSPLGDGTAIANNALYLMKGENGTLSLTTPGTYTNLSFLVLATEGNASVTAVVHYTDGSTQSYNNLTFNDWINGPNPVLSGFGRIKRIPGPFPPGTYEYSPTNPMFYAVDIAVSCSKQVSSIDFNNVTSGTNPNSTRAFVFAVSGATTTLPVAPTVAGVSLCPGQGGVLTVIAPDPAFNYSWYTAATGGGAIKTGTTYTTPALTTTTTYYVQASNSGGCASTRTPVTVTVLPPPADPVVASAQICPGQTTTLSVSSPVTGVTYSWFAAASGGTAIAAGNDYLTPALNTTTTYYVEADNGGCKSVNRTAVTVTILPALTDPGVAPTQVCANQTATLTITTPDPLLTYNWYTTSSGGTAFTTGTSITTPANLTTTTYYVQSSNGSGCSSALTPVLVTVLPALANPLATVNNVCNGATGTITISNADAANTYTWFDVATGGTPLFVGTSFTTNSLTSTTTFYVEASNAAGCRSTRVAVSVTVWPVVTAPVATAAEVCSGQPATINISNPDAATVYSYYTVGTGGTAVGTGTSFNTPAITGPITYYVESSNAAGCTSATRTAVNLTVAVVLPAPVVTASAITTSGITFSWNAIAGATGYEVAMNGGAYTTPSSGATGTTHTITGLISGQTATISVRALGVMSCQNSNAGTATAVTPSTEIFIPNVFTPNGDGRNDQFLVYGNDIASLNMKIFNQWGEMIFESRDNTKGWDGRSKGQQQPSGVYVYVANVTLRNGSVINRKGSLSLVR